MSTGAPKLSTSLDESQLSQVKECLASFAEQTSPGVHQDATMDNSYAMGFRSPSINALTGHGSPVQVRSLRDNEEEISTLRKENFNLKLRIYFLEQKAGICTDNDTPGGLGVTSSSASNTSCDGNYLKQNIDLKVEVESLRQDLQSKHDLLCQAVKAMEVLEESHKKAEERHRELVNDLNHRIENHQAEIRSLELMAGELQKQHRELQLSTSLRGDPELQQQQEQHAAEEAKEGMTTRDNVGESLLDFLDAVQQHSELSVQEKLKVLEMENAVRQCQERNEQLTRQVEQLQATIEEKASKISQLEMELGELRFENAELREESEKPQSNVEESARIERSSSFFERRKDRSIKFMFEQEQTSTSMQLVQLEQHDSSCVRCFTVESVSSTNGPAERPGESALNLPDVCLPCDELQSYFPPPRPPSDAGRRTKFTKSGTAAAPLLCRRVINEWANQYFIIEPRLGQEGEASSCWVETAHSALPHQWPHIVQWCLQKLNLSSSLVRSEL